MNILDLKLTQLAADVSKTIKNINHGGCCVFASLVAEHLKLITPTRLVVYKGWLGRAGADLSEAKKKVHNNSVEEWNAQGIHFGHVVIEYDNDGQTFRFDSDGIEQKLPPAELQLKGYLSIEDAVELAGDEDGWNPEFNRAHIPNLKRIIDTFFQQLSLDLQPAL